MTSRTDPERPSSPKPPIRRARPHLGTIVAISVGGLDEAPALAAIECGFAAIAEIHRLMSFHETGSDLSRLNREAFDHPVAIDPHTVAVLRQSAELAAASDGVFDITVASSLVDWGFLPRPDGAPEAEPGASWRDVELVAPNWARFHRRLRLDLGGIAKGYAVDRAVEAMALPATAQLVVNAGGDLRVAGPTPERVLLRAPARPGDPAPVVEIENASLASSGGGSETRLVGGLQIGPHLNGNGHIPSDAGNFVSVVAERCVIADSLTKIVLAKGMRAEPILRSYAATAYWRNPRGVWRTLGGDA